MLLYALAVAGCAQPAVQGADASAGGDLDVSSAGSADAAEPSGAKDAPSSDDLAADHQADGTEPDSVADEAELDSTADGAELDSMADGAGAPDGAAAGPVMLPWQPTATCAANSRKMCNLAISAGKPTFTVMSLVGPPVDTSKPGLPGQSMSTNGGAYYEYLPMFSPAWANKHASQGSLSTATWTYWHPFGLKLLPNGLVRLRALWINQFFSSEKHPP